MRTWWCWWVCTVWLVLGKGCAIGVSLSRLPHANLYPTDMQVTSVGKHTSDLDPYWQYSNTSKSTCHHNLMVICQYVLWCSGSPRKLKLQQHLYVSTSKTIRGHLLQVTDLRTPPVVDTPHQVPAPATTHERPKALEAPFHPEAKPSQGLEIPVAICCNHAHSFLNEIQRGVGSCSKWPPT